jgi:hypothetical protein
LLTRADSSFTVWAVLTDTDLEKDIIESLIDDKEKADWATEQEWEIGPATADFYKQTLNGILRFLGPRR